MEDWKEKWRRIESKFATCQQECVTAYQSDDKCRDAIEAVMADIWNLKDWLINDPTTSVTKQDINGVFLPSPESFNIRACGDIETKSKHLKVDDPRRENTELIWEGNHDHPSGFPVVFSVTRVYKDEPANTDHWEDAYEVARRAIEEWKQFLAKKSLALP